jgi:protein SCO1/2
MNKSTNLILVVAGVIVLAVGIYFASFKHALHALPFIGEKTVNAKGDTLFHTVSDFSLTCQTGKTITQKDLEGKIYVADYFFANCKSICPKISKQLERVQKHFADEPSVMIVSHTVDPKRDTVEALVAYAKLHDANPEKWLFLTGDKKQLYDLARHSYLVTASEGNGGDQDFVHTEQVALIDKEKRIRGCYDGTDSLAVGRLIVDIEQLLLSYKEK